MNQNATTALLILAGLSTHTKNLSALLLHAAQEGRDITGEELANVIAAASQTLAEHFDVLSNASPAAPASASEAPSSELTPL